MTTYVRGIFDSAPDGAWGVVDGDAIRLLDGSPLDGASETGVSAPLEAIRRYLPPVDPPNVLCIGANYAEHVKESGSQVDLPDHPLLFIKPTTAVTAHEAEIVLPAEAPDETDYEAELVAVIGTTARNVSEDEALDHVFGYTCGHDVSARDCQLRIDKQWARGKGFDTFAPLGPFLTTDVDPTDLGVRFRKNGVELQNSSTKHMIFSVAFLVSYLSRQMTLLPGTAVFTGTPDGVGMAREPKEFLRPGDTCEVEIDRLGVLRNTVRAEVR